MDPILQVLLSWQFMLFGLAVAMVVYVLRTVVEYLASSANFDLSKSKFWNDLVLPIIPILLGVVGAWMLTKFPYPGFTPNAQGIVARGDRLIFGLVTGGFSTVMYRVIKAILFQKIQGNAPYYPTYPPYPGYPPAPAPGPVVNVDVTANQLPPRGQV